MKNNIMLAIILFFAFAPLVSWANGGDQRIVENKYFINLSRAPFTPRVGIKTSFLASFVDIQKNKLIAEDLLVKVRIARLGGVGTNKRSFLFEKDNITVHGGVLELPYTFSESGLHEIFFDFAFVSHPEKIYEVPDFLMDVQDPIVQEKPNYVIPLAGVIAGFILGFFGRQIVNIVYR